VSTPARLGKYEITEVLGTGAMGVVYKGFDPGIRRIVAIKTIRRELITGDRPATAMLARFRNEARAAGRLSHPGIVAVHDYGEDAEVAYIAMEYVEGNSLREYFARGVKFSERDAISIVSQLLEALAHAHERRVWHRDIKPANLIVMTNGRVKVADFGIARIEASDLTQTGAVMGSPGYMAPEQYAARAIDHRADIFAAGVVFYQLLTGVRPFVGTSEQIAYAVCHTEALKPSAAAPGHRLERYDAILATALAKKPEDRYQSAESLRDAIVAVHAAPVSPTVSEDTIITEILRPGAAVDPSSPSRPQSVAPATASAPPSMRARTARPSLWGIGAGAAALVAAAGVWLAIGSKPPSSPPPAAATAPTPAAPTRAHPDEVVFWESVRNSTNRAELEAYLAKYPDGTFAPLARARIAALAASETKRASDAQREAGLKSRVAAAATPPAPERRAAAEPPRPDARKSEQPGQEALFWDSVRNSSNAAELSAYLAKYPDGTFAPLARARLDALAAAEAKRAAEAKATAAAPKAAAPKPAAPVPPSKVAAASPSAPAPAPPPRKAGAADRFDGVWPVQLACQPFEESPYRVTETRAEIRGGQVSTQFGTSGAPGYMALSGQIGDDDRLVLTGGGVSSVAKYRGQPFRARFEGRFDGRRYEGIGRVGLRDCKLTLQR
jgi:serine/threonine protein kinase